MSWKMLILIFLPFSESFGLCLSMKAGNVIFSNSLIPIFAHQKGELSNNVGRGSLVSQVVGDKASTMTSLIKRHLTSSAHIFGIKHV